MCIICIFLILFLAFGVVPHQWIDHTGKDLGWRKDKPLLGPGGILKSKAAGGFVVQVAALNDPDKAKQMRDQIAGSGLKAYTEVVPTAKGNVTRVRAGPFASKADAEKARDKLKVIGLPGNVVPK